MIPQITSASVKVLRSHDYCHFEVILGYHEDLATITKEGVDELRKEAARLADKAVEQYKIAKAAEGARCSIKEGWRVEQAQATPEAERAPQEKAVLKYHQDASFRARFDYDYQDDFEQP